MPYFFPYEDIFVYTIATLIVGLLYMRVRLARARRAHAESQPVDQDDGPEGETDRAAPFR